MRFDCSCALFVLLCFFPSLPSFLPSFLPPSPLLSWKTRVFYIFGAMNHPGTSIGYFAGRISESSFSRVVEMTSITASRITALQQRAQRCQTAGRRLREAIPGHLFLHSARVFSKKRYLACGASADHTQQFPRSSPSLEEEEDEFGDFDYGFSIEGISGEVDKKESTRPTPTNITTLIAGGFLLWIVTTFLIKAFFSMFAIVTTAFQYALFAAGIAFAVLVV